MDPQNQPEDPGQGQSSADDTAQPSPQTNDVQNFDKPFSGGGQSFKEVELPPEAEDADLIEKEWVDRAKQIVEHTREDPHEQQRALSHMKADYLKKRYNRDIKISED